MTRQYGGSGKRRSTWLVPTVVVIIAALLIAGVFLLNRDGDAESTAADTADTSPDAAVQGPAAPTAESAQPDLTSVETRDEADPLAVGAVDAPVGLVVFSDYQCPFCAKWSDETLPQMMEHVEDGNLRIEWRDVNIYGQPSERGSRAVYAAGLQDAFSEYHDAMFADGEIRSEPELSEDALIALAGELGLDTEQFTTDFNSPETAAATARNAQLGIDLGAYSTPAFLMGGHAIMGAQPTEVFQSAFDTALAEQG